MSTKLLQLPLFEIQSVAPDGVCSLAYKLASEERNLQNLCSKVDKYPKNAFLLLLTQKAIKGVRELRERLARILRTADGLQIALAKAILVSVIGEERLQAFMRLWVWEIMPKLKVC
jgi:hypothetical protein